MHVKAISRPLQSTFLGLQSLICRSDHYLTTHALICPLQRGLMARFSYKHKLLVGWLHVMCEQEQSHFCLDNVEYMQCDEGCGTPRPSISTCQLYWHHITNLRLFWWTQIQRRLASRFDRWGTARCWWQPQLSEFDAQRPPGSSL